MNWKPFRVLGFLFRVFREINERSYISRIENDASNMTLKTLFEIVEHGLGGKIKILIEL